MIGLGNFFGDTEVLLKTNKRKATAISRTTKLVVFFIEKDVFSLLKILKLIKTRSFF